MSARVHLINPSDLSFGVAVITPRWLYVLAAATGTQWGDPVIVDETLDPIDPKTIAKGDVVGIGIHTGNALRGYKVGRSARDAGATVVYGGIHATLFPEEVSKVLLMSAGPSGRLVQDIAVFRRYSPAFQRTPIPHRRKM